jgi:hypothetical protein
MVWCVCAVVFVTTTTNNKKGKNREAPSAGRVVLFFAFYFSLRCANDKFTPPLGITNPTQITPLIFLHFASFHIMLMYSRADS